MIEFMKKIARRAGAYAAAEQLHLSAENIHTKATDLDLVTDADRNTEKIIIDAIRKEYPDAGIYGEESGKSHIDREYCFIIDPIDGTASFVHGLPNWCVSIGLFHNGKPFAGVVYAPVNDELYYAETGKGAYLNGTRIHAGSRSLLKDCIMTTGFSCLRAKWTEENNLKFFSRIAPELADIRKYGSAALDCCLVARGATDAFWELYLQIYDIAAGLVILQEAGAVVTDLFGKADYPQHGFLTGNQVIHDKMIPFFHDYKCLQH